MAEHTSETTGLKIYPVDPAFAHEDPRTNPIVFGEPIQLGDTVFPDQGKYPNWQLTLLTFPGNPNRDGCLFSIDANTATPVGLVREPPPGNGSIQTPAFTERIVEGSGTLLIQTSDGIVQAIPVSADNPAVYRYGSGARVAYIAGPNGLVGVNIGEPPGIPEDSLPIDDPQASAELWDRYRELTSGLQTTKLVSPSSLRRHG